MYKSGELKHEVLEQLYYNNKDYSIKIYNFLLLIILLIVVYNVFITSIILIIICFLFKLALEAEVKKYIHDYNEKMLKDYEKSM